MRAMRTFLTLTSLWRSAQACRNDVKVCRWYSSGNTWIEVVMMMMMMMMMMLMSVMIFISVVIMIIGPHLDDALHEILLSNWVLTADHLFQHSR